MTDEFKLALEKIIFDANTHKVRIEDTVSEIEQALKAAGYRTSSEWYSEFEKALPKAKYIELANSADDDLFYERIGYRKGLKDAKKAAKEVGGSE
jgi:hypothetical protein